MCGSNALNEYGNSGNVKAIILNFINLKISLKIIKIKLKK
jgi:hypothetical protein